MGQPTVVTRRLPADQHTETNNVASVLSEIYRVWVPRGRVWKLDPLRAFLLRLATAEDITPGAVGASTDETTYGIARVLDSANGHADGAFQGIYIKADGTAATITAVNDHVDSGADSITISDGSAVVHRYCYVPYADGRIVIKIESPRGLGSLAYPIFEDDIKRIHSMNQHRFNSLASRIPLPPDFAIVFYLNAAWPIAFANGCTAGAVNLDFAQIEIPIIEADERDFFEPGREVKPGQNLRLRVEEMMARMVR